MSSSGYEDSSTGLQTQLYVIWGKKPRGKESTEVQITQNMGKERENSY